MYKFLKLAFALVPLFFLLAACEKGLSSAATDELAEMQTQVSIDVTGSVAAASFLPLPGTPTFVTTTWTRSGMPSCRYCHLKLTTSTISGATSYQWQVWMYGQAWLTKTTTTPVWNVGLWGEGQSCCIVKVRAVNASGAGAWYTSSQKCPPSNPPCCTP